jgi:signal transduction histidine kinase
MPAGSSDERLAILAHELRSPLAALTSAAEALERCANEPSIIRLSGIVSRQTAAMRVLVDELLDASRVTSGRLALQTADLDLRDVARNVVEDYRERIARASLLCELVVPARPITVNADAMKLRQVLGNLLSNAIKFTPAPGSVVVVIEASAASACLRVCDTGVGFSAELLPVIFDPYRQANRGSFGGLGLGLPIAKGIVELHGGEIRAFSDGPGRGCTITVRLPLATSAGQRETAERREFGDAAQG